MYFSHKLQIQDLDSSLNYCSAWGLWSRTSDDVLEDLDSITLGTEHTIPAQKHLQSNIRKMKKYKG